MAKLALRTQAITAVALCGLLAAACGTKDDGGGGSGSGGSAGITGGTTGVGGTGSGAGGTASGAGGTASGAGGGVGSTVCDGLTEVGGTVPLIDDFEVDGVSTIPEVDGRSGSWFVSNDGTLGGDQTPTATTSFPSADAAYNGNAGFASTATGFAEWGANFGVTLNASGDAGCAYDASAFEGIKFWARTGDGSSQNIEVKVPMPAVIPASRPGGQCVGEGCDDAHKTSINVTGEWKEYTIEWGVLSQNNDWAHDNKVPFDSKSIAQITLGVGGVVGAYNIHIDDLSFLGEGNPGLGGAQSK